MIGGINHKILLIWSIVHVLWKTEKLCQVKAMKNVLKRKKKSILNEYHTDFLKIYF